MIKKVSVNTIQKLKDNNEKIAVLTAYDYSTSKYLDECGVEIVLIGDSLAMVALGYENTQSIGVDEMKIFTKAVAKGVNRALVVTDMPFMSYNISLQNALENCGIMLANGADAVKIEGCNEYILNVITRCVQSGIPVMGHLGFTPQYLNTIGGYNIQGKSFDSTLEILRQAKLLEQAGVFCIVLEMVPEESAKFITENLRVPTIGIGAGKYCSGQVLVSDDLFGKFSNFTPKFARKYSDLKSIMSDAVVRYVKDVKDGNFPSESEVFNLSDDELNKLHEYEKGEFVKC